LNGEGEFPEIRANSTLSDPDPETYSIGMSDSSAWDFTLAHAGTAAALSHILPVLLLALLVEVRRARPGWCRHVLTRGIIIGFLLCFGVIETLYVLSIDGSLLPWRWSDLLAALSIFVLLAILGVLAMSDPRIDGLPADGSGRGDVRQAGEESDERS